MQQARIFCLFGNVLDVIGPAAPAGRRVGFLQCNDIDQGAGCAVAVSGAPLAGYCKITFSGSKKAVRGALTVVDANNDALQILEAR